MSDRISIKLLDKPVSARVLDYKLVGAMWKQADSEIIAERVGVTKDYVEYLRNFAVSERQIEFLSKKMEKVCYKDRGHNVVRVTVDPFIRDRMNEAGPSTSCIGRLVYRDWREHEYQD